MSRDRFDLNSIRLSPRDVVLAGVPGLAPDVEIDQSSAQSLDHGAGSNYECGAPSAGLLSTKWPEALPPIDLRARRPSRKGTHTGWERTDHTGAGTFLNRPVCRHWRRQALAV